GTLQPMTDAAHWSRADEWRERYRRAAGDGVEHDVRPYFAAIAAVSAVDIAGLPLPALTERARDLRARAEHEPLDALLPSVFAVTRELSHHTLGLRPFDVQMAA